MGKQTRLYSKPLGYLEITAQYCAPSLKHIHFTYKEYFFNPAQKKTLTSSLTPHTHLRSHSELAYTILSATLHLAQGDTNDSKPTNPSSKPINDQPKPAQEPPAPRDGVEL